MTATLKPIIYRLGLISLLILAVYGTTLNHGFIWDDTYIVVNNPLLEKLGNIPQLFLSEDTVEESTGYYRPVTYISFALDRAIWGVNPVGFHLTNLILHIWTVLLFYAVTATLFKKERLAFVASLIFALHPIAGETVHFISARNTLLSACFALLSLLFYIKKNKIPAVVSFTIAIFSKEFALLLPMIFLFYDFRIQREKFSFSKYIPYIISVAIYLVLRSFAVQKANFLSGISFSNIIEAPHLVVKYALNMIAPLNLKVLYNVQPDVVIEISSIVVIVVMTGAIFVYRKHDDLLFSACWFFLFLLPVINIIPLHATTMMADRYAYFSLMGFALCLAAVICTLNEKAVAVGIAGLCTIYILIDVSRNSIWKNDIKLFTRMTKDAPEKFAGFKNLGLAYYKKGELAAAVHNLAVADSKPDISYKYLTGDAYILWKENKLEQAEKALLRAHDLEPGNPEPYLVLMLMHEQNGNTTQARLYRDKTEELVHGIDQILVNRIIELCRAGETRMSKRQYVDAEVYFWQALKINPEYIPALIDMGSLRAEQGDYANAIQYFNKALTIDPMNATAHFNLSTLYEMQGRSADAQNEMTKFREAEAMAQQKKGNITGSSLTKSGQ